MRTTTKLKNGITLITVPIASTKAATVLAMFPVGSRYETREISGAAHFVEHMLFKGTARRPTAEHISRALDGVGADYNAFTFKDYTGYYVKAAADKQTVAFDLLSDMMYNSVFDQSEVAKEKGAVIEEMKMYEDNPSMAVDQLADKIVFGDTPLGWDIVGTRETIRGLSRDALWQFYRHHYSPLNMVLVVAGNVKPAAVKKYAGQYFGGAAAPAGAAKLEYYKTRYQKHRWPAAVPALEQRVAVAERTVDQAQVIINFPGLADNDRERYALSVLLNVLGGGMSSRLFVEVREKRGLAYSVKSGSTSYRDVGVWSIQAGLDSERLAEALGVIRKVVEDAGRHGITAEELANTKNYVTGRMVLSLEDSSSQAEWYAKEFLFSRAPLTPAQAVKKIRAVTRAEVNRLARRLLRWDRLHLALIGHFDKQKVLSFLS